MSAFLLLLASVLAQQELQDGVSVLGRIDKLLGGQIQYKFHLDQVIAGKDLSIALTYYSDFTDPDLYVQTGRTPSTDDPQWSSEQLGFDQIVISESELTADTDYHILVKSVTYSSFYITVSYVAEITLIQGVTLQSHLEIGQQAIYVFIPDETTDQVQIELSYSDFMYMYVGIDKIPSSEDSLASTVTWDNGWLFFNDQFEPGSKFYIVVDPVTSSHFSILATGGTNSIVQLQASVPVSGVVGAGEFKYYDFDVISNQETVVVQLTPFSGNPNLYISASQYPTEDENDFKSRRWGNDTIEITPQQRESLGKPVGTYYIGVYGGLMSSYQITVSLNSRSVIPLSPGVPQLGNVQKNALKYYDFRVQAGVDYEISLLLTPVIGNPSMFAKFCQNLNIEDCQITEEELENPEESGIWTDTSTSGSQLISFKHSNQTCTESACYYLVAIKGESERMAGFSIVMTLQSDTSILLRESSPMTLAMTEGYTYFSYTVQNMTTIGLDIYLTPVLQNPDLYVSRQGLPSTEEYQYKSTKQVAEVDRVRYTRGTDESTQSLEGTYYISVYSDEPCVFTILAFQSRPEYNTTIRLYPGRSQKDTLFDNPDRYQRLYYFNIHSTSETKQDIRISLTALTGRYTMFASNNIESIDWENSVFHYNWSSDDDSDNPIDNININKNDPNYLVDSTYVVLVQADRFSSNGTATYSISFQIGDGIVYLAENVPYSDSVFSSEYNYYQFSVHTEAEELAVSMTLQSGEAELFVSLDPNHPRPNNAHYYKKQSRFGSDIIFLDWDDLETDCPQTARSICEVYIGVHGQPNALYSMRVHSDSQIPQNLIVGDPQSGQIGTLQYAYYYSYVDIEDSLTISLTQNSGNSNLYIKVLDAQNIGAEPESWDLPTKDSNDFKSESTTFNEEINLTEDELQEFCESGDCVVVSGVQCQDQFCDFTIQAEQNSIPIILENQPRTGYVHEDEILFYQYYCNNDQNNLVIQLTSLNGNDPDLYVAKGRGRIDDFENDDWEWESADYGSDSILIRPQQEYFHDHSMIGTYVIAVYGFESAAFTLTVNNHPVPLTRLQSGNPLHGNLDAGESAYYYFINLFNTEITISLTPSRGSAFISVIPLYLDQVGWVYQNLPSRENYVWRSENSEDRNIISIDQDDDQFCEDCVYVIGVTTTEGCQYSITAKNDISLQALQNGIPVKGFIEEDEEIYFSFQIYKEDVDVDVFLTSYSGDPDLIVLVMNGDQDPYYWESYEVGKVDHVRILNEWEEFSMNYIIVVNGARDSYYSLTARTSDTYVKLVSGWPLAYSQKQDQDDAVFFQYEQDTYDFDVHCTVRPLSFWYKPEVYIAFTDARGNIAYPGPDMYQIAYLEEDYSEIYDMLFIVLEAREDTGRFQIGVYSNFIDDWDDWDWDDWDQDDWDQDDWDQDDWDDDDQDDWDDDDWDDDDWDDDDWDDDDWDDDWDQQYFPGQFQITCRGEQANTILNLQQSVFQIIPEEVTGFTYELNIDQRGHLQVYVTPCAGRLNLQISSNWTVFDQSSEPDIDISSLSDGALKGVITNAKGKYFITINKLEDSPIKDALESFELTTLFAPEGQSLPRLVVPGNEGLITFTQQRHSHVKLSWSPVKFEDGSAFHSKKRVVYKVFYSKETQANFVSACGILSAKMNAGAQQIGEFEGKHEGTVKLKHNKGILNILAVIDDDNVPEAYQQIAYDPIIIQFKSGQGHSGARRAVFWIVISLFLVALAVAVFFFIRYRRMKKRLEYEMNDVRNIGAAVERIDKGDIEIQEVPNQKLKYATLQEENQFNQIGFINVSGDLSLGEWLLRPSGWSLCIRKTRLL